MAIRLSCIICGRGTENFVVIDYMDAHGIAHRHCKLCRQCLGSRSTQCGIHKEGKVLFIDNTMVCPACVQRGSVRRYRRNPAHYWSLVNKFAQVVPKADITEFEELVKTSTERKASPALCLVIALQAFALRYHAKVDDVESELFARLEQTPSLIATLLPSSDPQKRFKPKP